MTMRFSWRVVTVSAMLAAAACAAVTTGVPRLTTMPPAIVAPLTATKSEPQPSATWRERLARNPADYASLLELGLQLEREGAKAQAVDAIAHALRLAPADRVVLWQSAQLMLRAGDEAGALRVLKRFADLYPADNVWPLFSAALDLPAHRAFMSAMARDDPKWWPSFFTYACRHASLAGLEAVFTIRAAAGTTTDTERGCAITRLQREQQWPRAYQAWLNSLPTDQRQRIGFVFNGDFERPLSNVGFDWVVVGQPGVLVTTDWRAGTNGRQALQVRFVDKRYVAPPIYEYLQLLPGRYRFDGRSRPEGLDTWLGLQWGLYCQNTAGADIRQLAKSEPFAGTSEWRAFRSEFVVGSGCPVQIVRLELANPKPGANAPGDAPVRLNGSVWFDDLAVTLLE